VDSKRGFAEPFQITQQPVEPSAAAPAAPKGPAEPRTPRLDSTWLASSFDLAQGLDVKVMESKLSRETLDSLFRT